MACVMSLGDSSVVDGQMPLFDFGILGARLVVERPLQGLGSDADFFRGF